MTNKIKVSKNVADAIDLFLKKTINEHVNKEQAKSILVAEHYGTDWTEYEDGQYAALNDILTSDLMKCMVHDYEPEKDGPKYLKTWTGVTTGSFAGRDDGFPETKYRVYNSLESLARGFRSFKDERHYKLERMNDNELEEIVKEIREENKKRKEKERKVKLRSEIQDLQKELETLKSHEAKEISKKNVDKLRKEVGKTWNEMT